GALGDLAHADLQSALAEQVGGGLHEALPIAFGIGAQAFGLFVHFVRIVALGGPGGIIDATGTLDRAWVHAVTIAAPSDAASSRSTAARWDRRSRTARATPAAASMIAA